RHAESGTGYAEKCFTNDLLNADGVLRGEGMVVGQKYLEGLFNQEAEVEIGAAVFPAKKGYVDSALRKRRCELWGILTGNYYVDIWQLIAQLLQHFREPRRFMTDHE